MLWVLVALYLVTVAVRLWLSLLNVRHRRRYADVVPPEFAGSVEPDTLRKISAYNADREAFGLWQLVASTAVTLAFLFGGGLAAYDEFVGQLVHGGIGQGVVFFVGIVLGSSILELPFDAFMTFRIEARHGFNRTTPGLFLADWCKGTSLSMLLLAGVAAVGLWFYHAVPEWYWLCFWGFAVVLSVVLMLIAPHVIEPLFIKTEPLANAELAEAVRKLSARAGAKVTSVLQVDASRRSAHSNAYFTGIGRVKRVVLFDTLLERLSGDEVLAVLGHELGHFRLGHITKRLTGSAVFLLVGFYAAARLLGWDGFSAWVGLAEASVAAKVIMLMFLASLVGFVVTPISAFLSRRHERQADGFAANLTGEGGHLASALIKLAADNLTNLHPHPWFAAFYYSHPPTAARVRVLLKEDAAAGG